MLLIGTIAGGTAFVAFLVLLVIGEWTFSPALFVALLVGIGVAVFLHVAYHKPPEPPAAAKSASAHERTAAPASEPVAAPAPGMETHAPEPAAAPEPVTETHTPAPEPEPVAETHIPEPEPPAAAETHVPEPQAPAADAGPGTRPAGLDGPRGGTADDLKKIKGVGPKLEALLNRMGFYHFDQVAAWSEAEVAWVDDNLEGFKGRVSRDNWIDQAKTLASGGDTEFSKKVDGGDVY